MQTTVGQLMINAVLPKHLRDYSRVLDKKGIKALLDKVAQENDSDLYRNVVHALHKIGSQSAQSVGSSFSIYDLRTPPKTKSMMDALKSKVTSIVERDDLTSEQKEAAIGNMVRKATPRIDETLLEEAKAAGNPFATQVISGSRGGPADFRSLIVGDLLVTDHKDRVIPMPLLNSYASGADPAEYWAGSYGARKGGIATKLATQESGFLAKQLVQAAHRQVVTTDDCETSRGIPTAVDDPDNVGTVLMEDIGPYKAGTVIDPRVQRKLKEHMSKQDDKDIFVRSPLTCEAPHGVCSKCVGIRERGTFPEIGDNVGIAAAQSLTEPLSQGALNVKHCLYYRELVRMADWSVKPICELRRGDAVMGVTDDGKITPTKVVDVYDNGVREVWRTIFRNGSTRATVQCMSTLEHKIRAIRMVSNSSEEHLNNVPRMLPIGKKSRYFHACGTTGFNDTGYEANDWALLVGLLLGDGCYTEAVDSVNFSTADLEFVDEVCTYLSQHNLKLSKLKGHDYYYKLAMIEDSLEDYRGPGGQVTSGTRNPIRKFLELHGMYGKLAHEKCIPDTFIRSWSNASIAAIISGLVITDGSVYPLASGAGFGISLSSTSRKMLEQVRELLEYRFGIYSSEVTRTAKAGHNNYVHDMFAFTITRLESLYRFNEYIQLYGCKRRKLDEYISAAPALTPARTRYRRRRTLQEFVGMLPTYDIQVELDSHCFLLASGLIVSNSGGRAKGSEEEDQLVGFPLVNQLVQVPRSFRGGAAVASMDGTVDSVEDAPQGGKIITIKGKTHYAPQGTNVNVKAGDRVEAGDIMSTGIPNPAELVKHRGIGAGRLEFVKTFKNAYNSSGLRANRRNIELLARGLVNHVKVMDLDGVNNALPDDVVEYSSIEHDYQPRYGFRVTKPTAAVGSYLEKPIRQYSIGTRVTKRVADELKKRGVTEITTHADAPSFEPHMVRAMQQLSIDPDWQVRLGGSYLSRGLLEGLHRGRGSTPDSTSYIPSLARGTGFGADLEETGKY